MSVALVTGAGRGVGRGCALGLGAAGHAVVVASRTADNGEPVAEEIRAAGGRAICVPTDVLSRDAIFAAVARGVDEFGGLDVMVHNAFTGTGRPYRVEDAGDDEWERTSRSAVWASIWCAQAASAHLKASECGRLILVSSAAGIEGSDSLPLYAAVKAGQRGLAMSLAREWGPDGVTVNCIAPLAATDALSYAFHKNPDLKPFLESRVALGRLGDPERDIGPVLAFLASEAAGYITGQTIVCDGGNYIA
ncbi:MAG TPA: SDR family oxidoreductase [Acidimicrobiales bacterium]|nr:SDR family oxidoreductase [Acidimicrobiales bacterium]